MSVSKQFGVCLDKDFGEALKVAHVDGVGLFNRLLQGGGLSAGGQLYEKTQVLVAIRALVFAHERRIANPRAAGKMFGGAVGTLPAPEARDSSRVDARKECPAVASPVNRCLWHSCPLRPISVAPDSDQRRLQRAERSARNRQHPAYRHSESGRGSGPRSPFPVLLTAAVSLSYARLRC